MHIVIILDHAHINGGQANVALNSALGLKARGHDVTVFAAVGPVDPRLTEAGIETVCLGQDDIRSQRNPVVFAAQVIWNGKALRALDDLLARLDPARTLVHVHGWAKALSSSIGQALARHPAIPVAFTMHEYFLVCPNGGFYDYRSHEICHRKPMSMACVTRNCDSRTYLHKLLRVARQGAVDWFSGLPEACRDVFTISDLQMEVAAPYFRPGTRFHRVDNPIDVPALGPKSAPGRDFVFVGRLSTEKGADLFGEAARRAGFRAVFAGDGPQGEELRARFPEATFLGWKDSEGVRDVLREARAMVFPSVWYEGQPLTVLESLAVGTPVIVSDVCAGRESVLDGETGLWFRSGDPDDLARALRSLADDEVASRMTCAAYDRYWAHPLTVERHLDRIEELYGTMLHEKAGIIRVPGTQKRPRERQAHAGV